MTHLASSKSLPREYDFGILTRVFSKIDDFVNNFGNNQHPAVTQTADFDATDVWHICNGAGTITVTLPNPVTYFGPPLHFKTIAAFTVVSASANVVPLAGGAAGTAILAATAGKWATLVIDGVSWVIVEGN